MKIKVFTKSGSLFTGQTDSNFAYELQKRIKDQDTVYVKHESGIEYIIPMLNIDVIELG